VVGLGQLLADGADTESRLREHAADARWRVREAVAIALQRLGDTDMERLLVIVDRWAADDHPLVQRAAVAAICEPRLLRDPEPAGHAIAVCDKVTAALLARPVAERKGADCRTLRKALGYCWSVAVAAEPGPGLAVFRGLEAYDDPDAVWITRENLKKTRLKRVLSSADA
jgi:hypothetical protein